MRNKTVKRHHACNLCQSSDAATTYEDAEGKHYVKCYSCGQTEQLSTPTSSTFIPYRTRPMHVIDLPSDLTLDDNHPFLKKRGLKASTLAKFGAGFTQGGEVVTAVYLNDQGLPVLMKHRGKGKKFWIEGSENTEHVGLYGWHAANTRKNLLIVEGEVDAWSAYQMLEGTYSVVSVPFGCEDSVSRVLLDLEKVEKYERVVVMLDSDKQGQAAQAAILDALPGAYAASHVTGFKDASDYLQAGDTKAFTSAVWGAVSVAPSGFLEVSDLVAQTKSFLANPDQSIGLSFGYEGLDDMLGGQRPGEVITWAAGTGGGKSTMMRNLLWKLTQQEVKTLYLPFEDLVQASLTQLAQLEIGRNILRLPQQERTEELLGKVGQTLEAMLQSLTIIGNFQWHTPEEVLKKLEYGIRRYGSRVVVIDHITWLAEASVEDSRQVLERVMPNLKSLATRFGVTIHIVTHISRDSKDKDDTEPTLNRLKNSSAIQQISDAVVGLSGRRDENLVKLTMLKQSRLWGRSDTPEVVLKYDTSTTRLEEASDDFASDWGEEEESYPNGTSNEVPNEKQVRRERNESKRRSRRHDVRASEGINDATNNLQTRPPTAERTGSGDEGSSSQSPGVSEENIHSGYWVKGASWPGFEDWGPSPDDNLFPWPGEEGLDPTLGPQWNHRSNWNQKIPGGSTSFRQEVLATVNKALD